MKIFLSWSGKKANKIANELNKWLPTVIQSIKIFFSPVDIEKGKMWRNDISRALEESNFGIIVLTNENFLSPWILFEAGALSKNINNSNVCTFLFDVKETDLQDPWTLFQNTKFIKEDVFKLLFSINKQLFENALEKEILDKTFTTMWPELEEAINTILNAPEDVEKEIRTDRNILEEILRNTRATRFRYLGDQNYNFFSKIHLQKNSKVEFNKESNTIEFYLDEREVYHLNLSQLNQSSQILDLIFQVNSKGWANEWHIKGLIDCLEELSMDFFNIEFQGLVCPFGTFKYVDWENRIVRDLNN